MFSDPRIIWFVVIPLVVLVLRWSNLHGRNAIPFPSFSWLPSTGRNDAAPLHVLLLVRSLALCSVVPIIAGIGGSAREAPQPQEPRSALMIVLDVSSSMTADDFAPTDRLEEAKKRLEQFTTSSQGEVGLILFAALPRLVVPVTSDRQALSGSIGLAAAAGYDEDGTAIGSALAGAVNRLRDGPWLRRRILLITDGASNRGALAPLDAAGMAAVFDIRIDTIGIGTDAVSRFRVPAADGTQIQVEARIDTDERTLASLASKTGGVYQRVKDSAGLARALDRIYAGDRATAPRETAGRAVRLARILALASLVVIVTEFFLSYFVYALLPE